jgi:ergothioneine biosynthesis protein EgtB
MIRFETREAARQLACRPKRPIMVVRSPVTDLATRLAETRCATESLCEPLTPEDMQVQPIPEASPAKWHLGHTTWFFERFVLEGPRFRPGWDYLFNSYYDAIGPRHPRPERGLLSRPSLEEVIDYRRATDERLHQLLRGRPDAATLATLELGINHEQQHQELLLTDVKHLFWKNPLKLAYRDDGPRAAGELRWVGFEERLAEVGAPAEGFAFDNERPRHRVFVEPFEIASRLVTAGEYRAFVQEGGYERPELWLADGWRAVQERGWKGPLYWSSDARTVFSVGGERSLEPDEPVSHVSFYEADAFARWAGARLPREEEWEVAALQDGRSLEQVADTCWQWTASAYVAYPGFVREGGALGEYNAKFFCNQLVLRGGSAFTPAGHARPSYRNFFSPETRWQLSGIRLAR